MSLYESLNAFYYNMSLNELLMMNKNTVYPNITYNSLLYLDLITYFARCTPSKLAQALQISKSAVTVKVNELIRQGLVVKTQSETDRRVFYLSISPKVERDYRQYDKKLRNAVSAIQKRYSVEDIEKMCEMISILNDCYYDKKLEENGKGFD